jgi:hypothetical protein
MITSLTLNLVSCGSFKWAGRMKQWAWIVCCDSILLANPVCWHPIAANTFTGSQYSLKGRFAQLYEVGRGRKSHGLARKLV